MIRTDKKVLSLAEEIAEYIQLSVRNRGGEQIHIHDLSPDGFTVRNANDLLLGKVLHFRDNRKKPLMLSRADNTFGHYSNDPEGVGRLQEDLINLALKNGKVERVS